MAIFFQKIRKWIRKELESKYVTNNLVNNVMADKALAWLEKQGTRPRYNIGDVICDKSCTTLDIPPTTLGGYSHVNINIFIDIPLS